MPKRKPLTVAEPMTGVPDFERSHEDACAEEGHLLHDLGTQFICLRCPHTEDKPEQ